MVVLRFLWGTILPTIGLLSLASFPMVLWLEGYFHSYEYEFDSPEPKVLERIPSPDEELDLIVIASPYGGQNVQLGLVKKGDKSGAFDFTEGLMFDWAYEGEPIPIHLTWSDNRVVTIKYCGLSITGQNSISSKAGNVDVQIMRFPDCDKQIKEAHNSATINGTVISLTQPPE